MTSPLLPGDRPAPLSLLAVPLLTLVLGALAVVAAVLLGPEPARGAVGITGTVAALLLCTAVTVATRATLSARAARGRLEAVTEDIGRLLQERARLTEESRRQHERLTGELTRERARLSADLDQERTRLAETLAAERDRLTEQHAAAVAELTQKHGEEQTSLTAAADHLREENERLAARLREATAARAAALSATANAAGRMQALATGMLADLRAMEDKHHDEEVLADLLHLDHRTAQAGRLADSVAVLTGARSGRRWARPIGMESILRGAMGRISGYQRVRVHSTSDTAVAGHAAEGVMHALAELLDNAAKFSPPTAEVHVYVEEVPAGVIVSVEDSGLVMGEAQLRRAERAVSGEATELGGLTGTRLGLAVVGRLALRYGLKISYRPSARGGTGVLMLIPQDILAPATTPATPPTAVRTGSSAPAAIGTGAPSSPPATTAAGASGTPATTTAGTPGTAASADEPTRAGSPPATAGSGDKAWAATSAPAEDPSPRSTATASDTAPTGSASPATASGTSASGTSASGAALPGGVAAAFVAAEPSDGSPVAADRPASPAVAGEGAPRLPRRGGGAPSDGPADQADRTVPDPGVRTSSPSADQAHDAPARNHPSTPSYAAARSGGDLDPEPVPAHDSPERRDADAAPLTLPRRRRGRTLAEAERARAGSAAPAPRPAPTAEETRARTARFHSFRQAVRGAAPDEAAAQAPDPDDARTPATPRTPEGDTTT